MDKVNLNYIKSNRKLEPIDFLVLIQNKNLKEYIDYLTTIHYENPIEFQDKIIDMLSKFSIERGSRDFTWKDIKNNFDEIGASVKVEYEIEMSK